MADEIYRLTIGGKTLTLSFTKSTRQFVVSVLANDVTNSMTLTVHNLTDILSFLTNIHTRLLIGR